MKKKYQIGVYEKAFRDEIPIYNMVRMSSELGYDFFEISIDRSENRISRLYDDNFIYECINASRANKIQIGSMCLSALSTYTIGNFDSEISNYAMNILEQAIMFASKLGIRIIQIPGCDVPKNESHTAYTKDKYIKNLFRATEMASIYGICLAIENMEDEFMNTVQKTMKYVKLVNSPYLQIYPDSGNITAACNLQKINYTEDMKFGLGHYVAFHLKETRRDKYGGLFYGDGNVDFFLMVKNAWDLGVRRFVMEFWYTGNEFWKEDLRTANMLCRKWVDSATYVE